jgi:hypothetical protein
MAVLPNLEVNKTPQVLLSLFFFLLQAGNCRQMSRGIDYSVIITQKLLMCALVIHIAST